MPDKGNATTKRILGLLDDMDDLLARIREQARELEEKGDGDER